MTRPAGGILDAPPKHDPDGLILPHNLDAERSVLGAALLHVTASDYIADHLRPEQFFRRVHQTVFEAIRDLRRVASAVDLTTIAAKLGEKKTESIGGPAFLSSLVDGVPRSSNIEHYCLATSERILTADLRWVPVGDITTDDQVLGFDENASLRRKWQIAEVMKSEPTMAECVRVILEDQTTVICTSDHRWLVESGSGREWVKSEQLLRGYIKGGRHPGRMTIRPVTPWRSSNEWRSGWLAGIFDGEGYVWFGRNGCGSRLGFAQKSGAVLESALGLLRENSFRFSVQQQSSGVNTVNINGGLTEHLRLLGSIRPIRLLHDFTSKWQPRFFQGRQNLRVVAVEGVGRREIQQIATSTGTLIGEGFAMHNCTILTDLHAKRALIAYAHRTVDLVVAGEHGAPALLADADRRLIDLQAGHVESRLRSLRDTQDARLARLEWRHEHRGEITGIETGFQAINDLTLGWQPGELIIIAARPSIGKTTFVMNTAWAARQAGKRVAVFSLEMRLEQLEDRLLSSLSGVPLTRLASGHVMTPDWPKISQAHALMAAQPFDIDDRSGQTAWEIRSTCRRLKAEAGLDLVIIDYVQLIPGSLERRGATRNDEVTDISRRLKTLADEVSCPILLLSQLSRANEKRTDPRPKLSDLRESGALEQDADTVCFLHRSDHRKGGMTAFIMEKQRNGPTGTIPLWLDRDIVTFTTPTDEQIASAQPAPKAEKKRARPGED